VRLIDLDTGKSRLIVSLSQLANTAPRSDMAGSHHWVNHIQVSPSGGRIAFFHIWRVGKDGWTVRLYTCELDGSDLTCLLDTDFVSHYDWMDDDRIFVWTRLPGMGERFALCDRRDGSRRVVGQGVLTEDGHGSFSPDREWIVNDTYPDRYGMRTLMLYRPLGARRIDLARLYSPKSRWWGEIRCDLHPRWSRDGRQICVDSVHSGERQMYIVDVSRYLP
jgi:Tol biopolymer transport system component